MVPCLSMIRHVSSTFIWSSLCAQILVLFYINVVCVIVNLCWTLSVERERERERERLGHTHAVVSINFHSVASLASGIYYEIFSAIDLFPVACFVLLMIFLYLYSFHPVLGPSEVNYIYGIHIKSFISRGILKRKCFAVPMIFLLHSNFCTSNSHPC